MKKTHIFAIFALVIPLFACCTILGIVCNSFLGQKHAPVDLSLDDNRKIYIRIKNETDKHISYAFLGETYNRPSTYATYSYSTRFANIPPGDASEYEMICNIPFCYNRLRINFSDRTYANSTTEQMEELLQNAPTSPVSWGTPYLDNVVTRDGLIDGHYTLILKEFYPDGGQLMDKEDGGFIVTKSMELELRKDD